MRRMLSAQREKFPMKQSKQKFISPLNSKVYQVIRWRPHLVHHHAMEIVTCSSTTMISAIRRPMVFMVLRGPPDEEVAASQSHRRGEWMKILLVWKKINFLYHFSRVRLTSQGHDMTDDEDDSTDERFYEPNHLIHEHYNYMAFRENMQEFPGRVPQRKRKKDQENPQQDSSKPKVIKEKKIFSSVRLGDSKANHIRPLSIRKSNAHSKRDERREGKNFHLSHPIRSFHNLFRNNCY